MSQKGTATSIWIAPIFLGVVMAIGLVLALFYEAGMGDGLANLCLAIPTVALIWYGFLRRDKK